jgi:MFS family permease
MVVISAGVLLAHALTLYAFGVFLKPMTMEFNWDRGALSAAYSMSVLVGGGLGILSGRLTDKYGPRPIVTIGGLLTGIAFLLMSQISALWQVYLIWGIPMGIGFSFCLIPVMSIIPRWFIKRRGIAMGLVMTGMGLGGIITPPLAQWLISASGWRWAYIILGVITLVIIIPIAQFMKHSPQRAGLKPYGEDEIIEDKQPQSSAMEGLSFSQAIRTSRFWLFGLILASFFFCFGTVIVHIVPHASDIGIPTIIAASIVSIAAGVSIIARLGIGFISDRVGGTLALSACVSLVTLALIWLLFAREIWMFYVFAVVFGLSYGGLITLLPVVAAELFGLVSLGIILGGLTFVGTIGEALGAPLSGTIFDTTGSYRLAFIIAIVICAVAVILSLILLKYKVKTGMARE